MTFWGIQPELWSFHRRKAKQATVEDVVYEVKLAESSLVNALSFGSTGRGRLDRVDRQHLIELIDQVRNFIDHLEE